MKFFNSDKSGFLSFVAKRMKALFALFFIIAGTSSVWGQNPELSWTYASAMSGWADAVGKSEYTFIRQDVVFAGNNYTHYLDIEFQSAGTDNYKLIEDGKNWYGMETTIPYQCKWWEWKSGAGNTAFQHNAGKYRFYINANSDQRKITVTGIFVTIDEEPVNNGDGTYTITGHYTNANPSQQNINTYQIVFSEGVGQGVGANETATVGKDGSFSITKQLVEGQPYTCCARVIDGPIGNHDSKYITFTAEAATPEPEPEPTVTDLYLRGDQMGWGAQSSDEWKQTSVSSDGNVYTWDWISVPKTINGNFKIAALPADGSWDSDNNFGPKDNDVTLSFENGVATVKVWSDGGSKNINTTEQVSKIEFDKVALTVTFYTTEQPTPVFGATITATPGTEQIDLTSILTESVAGTDLTSATCQFQYKAADAGDETYADMSETASVKYSGEGATRTATLSQSMAAGSYVFRAVWTYNSREVANAVTETVTIPSDTPTPTDIEFYVRGEKIGCTPSEGGDCWGVASGEFKATSKEGNVYVWDWSLQPKLMVGPFKIADANFSDANNYGLDNKTTINLTDGKWTGTLQVNTASGDMIISEPGWNVSKITFDYDTKILEIFATPVFKDIWFRSSIVENGWGDDISDPIGSGVSPKYQGQTTDGKVYTWDWSGSNAVTVESGTEFKFGEYTGSSSWGNSGYAPNGQPSVTSADFGTEISVQVAAGNFSAGEKITITKITLNTETLKLELEGEQYKERFPVTVNTVNGEVGGAVVTEPADIGNMAIGETVTVTATANEGYVALFEAKSGCVMTDGSADNIKVFEITEANPVITVTFQVQCETVEPGFSISGRFNAGIEDADGLYQGRPISSKEADPANGYWSDGARFIQLTANSVPANYFEWVCTGYAIDGVDQKTVPEIAWTDQYKTSARAELSLPGTYTFVCNAKCNLGDDWTQSDTLTITAPVPAMGFDGAGIVGSSWDHTSAGREGEGLMTRQNGSLVWKSRSLKVNGFTDADEFVIIQQYKRYGCTPNNGWNGWNECQAVIGNDWGNKINGSNLKFSYVKWKNDAKGSNFLPVNAGSWVAGADGTDLQLVVTMTGHDSYTVELAEYKNIIATATTEPADGSRGTVSMAAPDGTIIPSGSNVADYVGQQVTLTASPAHGYKVASWEINGKVTESDRTTISPKLSGDGLEVVVTFERDCYAGVAYDLTGGGVICAEGGKTELSLNTLINVTYRLYKDGEEYDDPVQGDGEAAKWTISETGTYTAKAYDSRHEDCKAQAIPMKGSAVVTSVKAPEISVNPGANVHLTVLQARSFTAKVPVDWSITEVTGSGRYCEGVGYMISSQTDTSLVAKFLCIGTAKITATMKATNQDCKAEVTVYQNAAETEVCAPEPKDMQ